jgi:hypothetical protein
MMISNNFLKTFVPPKPWQALDLLTAIFTQIRGGALPLMAQHKAYDWCKFSPSFA